MYVYHITFEGVESPAAVKDVLLMGWEETVEGAVPVVAPPPNKSP